MLRTQLVIPKNVSAKAKFRISVYEEKKDYFSPYPVSETITVMAYNKLTASDKLTVNFKNKTALLNSTDISSIQTMSYNHPSKVRGSYTLSGDNTILTVNPIIKADYSYIKK